MKKVRMLLRQRFALWESRRVFEMPVTDYRHQASDLFYGKKAQRETFRKAAFIYPDPARVQPFLYYFSDGNKRRLPAALRDGASDGQYRGGPFDERVLFLSAFPSYPLPAAGGGAGALSAGK